MKPAAEATSKQAVRPPAHPVPKVDPRVILPQAWVINPARNTYSHQQTAGVNQWHAEAANA